MAFKDFVTEWGHLYNAASAAFSKDVAAATKGGSQEGAAVSKVLSVPKNGTAPLVQSLDRIGKLDLQTLTGKALETKLAALSKELKTLSSEAKKYTTALDAAINGEVAISSTVKQKVKDRLPDSYRQLKLLKTGLAAIEARLANEFKTYSQANAVQKIADKQAKGMNKARGEGNEDKAKAIEAEARLKKLLLSLSTSFNSSMKKGALVIQKIKAKPDVATYNKEMDRGGRDIRQNVLNIGLMKINPGTKDLKEVKALPAPGSLTTEIEEFATDTGGLRRLPDTASQADVLRAAAKFTALHKRIATTYAGLSKLK